MTEGNGEVRELSKGWVELKWAFEGKLTEEWRKQQSTLKTGEALLAQIKAERENRYQQQLAE